MKIKEIEGFGFRNLRDFRLTLGPENVTLLAGLNAQGKTNFLEAVSVLATTKSFRTQRDRDLVAWGGTGYRITASVERSSSNGGTVYEEIGISFEEKKKAFFQGTELNKLSEILGRLKATLLVPDDLELISGSPSHRRRALDLFLCQQSPLYLKALQDFHRASRHRGRLLSESDDAAAVHAWDGVLAEAGAEIMIRRRKAVAALLGRVRTVHDRMTSSRNGRLLMSYRPSFNPGEQEADWDRASMRQRYWAELEARTPNEMRAGYSLWGPARDDVELFIEKNKELIDLRRYGSQGQRRTAALAWRIAEAQIIAEESGAHDPPVVLIDDVLGELDGGRTEALLEHLKAGDLLGPETQIIMTTTDAKKLQRIFPEAQVLNASEGVINEQS